MDGEGDDQAETEHSQQVLGDLRNPETGRRGEADSGTTI
jgi:hypothetical protein